jgi:GTPase SAR1 family protein
MFKVARSFELKQEAINYLKKLFNMHSVRVGDTSLLDQQGLEKVFSTCSKSDGFPFDAKKETQFQNGLTLELWIGLWQKVFCEKPKQAFKFLVYTGFIGGQMKDVVQPIQIKTRDILGQGNQHRRFVFNVFIVGH